MRTYQKYFIAICIPSSEHFVRFRSPLLDCCLHPKWERGGSKWEINNGSLAHARACTHTSQAVGKT